MVDGQVEGQLTQSPRSRHFTEEVSYECVDLYNCWNRDRSTHLNGDHPFDVQVPPAPPCLKSFTGLYYIIVINRSEHQPRVVCLVKRVVQREAAIKH